MKRGAVLKTALAVLLVAALAAAYSLLPLKTWASALLVWIRGFGLQGAAIYGAVYSLAVLIFPASVLTAGAGLVYGTLIGVLIVSPASVLGATLAFLVARYFAHNWVESRIASQPKFAAIQRAVERNGFKLILLLRLQPVLPFVFLNYALGLTRVRLRDYILASWIGMLPGTILYVYLGSALSSVDELFRPGSLQHGGWTRVLFWAGLAAAALLSVWAGRLGRAALREELNAQQDAARSVA